VARIDYDEFGLFHENAEEHGIDFQVPPVVRRESVEVAPGRRVSALVWGVGAPELVLLHGAAQNAHTWDTVALALGRPLVAIDLPSHGHSDAAQEGSLSVRQLASDLARAVQSLAAEARAVVGMSLGGLTALALSAEAPELVRRLALVDITPGVTPAKAAAFTAFTDGPPSYASFEEILVRTIEQNPTRSVPSLRRGILHNAIERDDGTWVWRYARFPHATKVRLDYGDLWDTVSSLPAPLLLVRGTSPGTMVDGADERELLRRRPDAQVARVPGAGHSVQGDQPLVLAKLLDDFVP